MSRVITWLQHHEKRMFLWANHKISDTLAYWFLSRLTHMGGAAFTIIVSFCIWLFAGSPWSVVGLEALAALTASHIPVAVMKRAYPRLRPYLVFPEANICKKPLKDHSFPSGHTTAIFSVITPFIFANPSLAIILLPIGGIVGFSRMYLGLHYPSDLAAGCALGVTAGAIATALIG